MNADSESAAADASASGGSWERAEDARRPRDWAGADRRLKRRRLFSRLSRHGFFLATLLGIVSLVVLLAAVLWTGAPHLSWRLISAWPSRFAQKAGLKSALFGTLWLISLTALMCVPVGIGAAVYLEEYPRKGRLMTLIEVNIANLAGVPSIVYGVLGLGLFVRWWKMGSSVMAGALTLSLLVLPMIIIASREALRAVPRTIRDAAMALGATRWQTIRHHVVPAALPGILTGIILSLSRAMGETAPIIIMGGLAYVSFIPENPIKDEFSALPIQVYNWASRPQAEFAGLAAAGIIVLLVVLLTMNAVAVYLRRRARKKLQW